MISDYNDIRATVVTTPEKDADRIVAVKCWSFGRAAVISSLGGEHGHLVRQGSGP
jgi:hypothetical protein